MRALYMFVYLDLAIFKIVVRTEYWVYNTDFFWILHFKSLLRRIVWIKVLLS